MASCGASEYAIDLGSYATLNKITCMCWSFRAPSRNEDPIGSIPLARGVICMWGACLQVASVDRKTTRECTGLAWSYKASKRAKKGAHCRMSRACWAMIRTSHSDRSVQEDFQISSQFKGLFPSPARMFVRPACP